MRHQTRRGVLACIGTGMAASLGGCTGFLGGNGPDPEVTAPQGPSDLYPVEGGDPVVQGIVDNNGGSGKVEVTVTFYSDAGQELSQRTKTVEMESDGTREIGFSPPFPDQAETYEMTAKGA